MLQKFNDRIYNFGYYGTDPVAIVIGQFQRQDKHTLPKEEGAQLIERSVHDRMIKREAKYALEALERPNNPIAQLRAQWYTVDQGIRNFSDFYKHVGPQPEADYGLTQKDQRYGYTHGNIVWRPIKICMDYISSDNEITRNVHRSIEDRLLGITGVYRDKPKGDYHAILAEPSEIPIYLGSTRTKNQSLERLWIAAQYVIEHNQATPTEVRDYARITAGYEEGKPISHNKKGEALSITDYCGVLCHADNTVTVYQPPTFLEWAIGKPAQR